MSLSRENDLRPKWIWPPNRCVNDENSSWSCWAGDVMITELKEKNMRKNIYGHRNVEDDAFQMHK